MDLKRRAAVLVMAFATAFSCGIQTLAAETSQGAVAYAEKTVSVVKADEKPGKYEENVYVLLSCSTRDARIFYTIDGSEPSIRSEEYYGDAIRIKGKPGESVTVTIRAIAVKTGYNNSDIAECLWSDLEDLDFPWYISVIGISTGTTTLTISNDFTDKTATVINIRI